MHLNPSYCTEIWCWMLYFRAYMYAFHHFYFSKISWYYYINCTIYKRFLSDFGPLFPLLIFISCLWLNKQFSKSFFLRSEKLIKSPTSSCCLARVLSIFYLSIFCLCFRFFCCVHRIFLRKQAFLCSVSFYLFSFFYAARIVIFLLNHVFLCLEVFLFVYVLLFLYTLFIILYTLLVLFTFMNISKYRPYFICMWLISLSP